MFRLFCRLPQIGSSSDIWKWISKTLRICENTCEFFEQVSNLVYIFSYSYRGHSQRGVQPKGGERGLRNPGKPGQVGVGVGGIERKVFLYIYKFLFEWTVHQPLSIWKSQKSRFVIDRSHYYICCTLVF